MLHTHTNMPLFWKMHLKFSANKKNAISVFFQQNYENFLSTTATTTTTLATTIRYLKLLIINGSTSNVFLRPLLSFNYSTKIVIRFDIFQSSRVFVRYVFYQFSADGQVGKDLANKMSLNFRRHYLFSWGIRKSSGTLQSKDKASNLCIGCARCISNILEVHSAYISSRHAEESSCFVTEIIWT